jgi:hypothetical protein
MTTKKVLVLVAILACLALPALAQETAGGAGAAPSGVKWGAISAAFLLGIAAAGPDRPGDVGRRGRHFPQSRGRGASGR